jgi:signal transduction histidine kinase
VESPELDTGGLGPTIPRVSAKSALDILTRFARLASEAGTGSAILPLLADALVEHVGADAVAIVEIQEGGMKLVESLHLPKGLSSRAIDPSAIGEELDRDLLAACEETFQQVESHPLVSSGGLFGSVMMLFHLRGPPERRTLAEGLIDLAAVTLGSASKLQQLARSNAELRASQETLARSEKLRALGQMAAGVSHDLKNILNPLSLQLQLVDRSIDNNQIADAKETLGEMKQVLTRGLQTIERLRDYSRQSPESRVEAIDLNQLAHEAGEIAKPRMAARRGRLNRFVEELGAPPPVRGRPADVLSAMVNLIVNAIEAMPNGGTIVLRTGVSEERGWIQVSDDGPGMPPDVERRIFEPFFTTKGDEGTGLGLAMVYACMQRHGGTVTVETAPGKGTTFTLSFPKFDPAADNRG